MIQRLTDKITNAWIGTDIDKEDWEVYQFGIGIIVSTVLEMATILILGVLFKQFLGTCLFLLCFLMLRTNIGGYHAKSYERCYIVMILTYLGAYTCIALTPLQWIWPAIIVIAVVSFIGVVFLGPIDNENKRWEAERTERAKRTSIAISLLEIVASIAIAIAFPQYIKLSFWIMLSLLSTVVLLLIAHLQARKQA